MKQILTAKAALATALAFGLVLVACSDASGPFSQLPAEPAQIVISGKARQGETLTATANKAASADGKVRWYSFDNSAAARRATTEPVIDFDPGDGDPCEVRTFDPDYRDGVDPWWAKWGPSNTAQLSVAEKYRWVRAYGDNCASNVIGRVEDKFEPYIESSLRPATGSVVKGGTLECTLKFQVTYSCDVYTRTRSVEGPHASGTGIIADALSQERIGATGPGITGTIIYTQKATLTVDPLETAATLTIRVNHGDQSDQTWTTTVSIR